MPDFVGARCPYCKKAFKPDDDLAVCPVCGTPHHRACYKEHGSCFNEAKHESGYEWKRRVSSAKSTAGSVVCERCGRVNAADNTVCGGCGRPLKKKTLSDPAGYTDTAASSPTVSASPSPAPTGDSAFLPVQTNTQSLYAEDEIIDGVTAKDWKTYIGSGTPYYFYYFKLQDRTSKKLAFTWSAALFPVLYFLYRRLWTLAAAAFAIKLVCAVPSVAMLYFSGLGLSDGFWSTAGSVSSMILFASDLVWGIFAVWLYRKRSGKKLRNMRGTSATEAEFAHRLGRTSGPSYIAVFLAVGAVFLLTALLLSFPNSFSEIISQGVMI